MIKYPITVVGDAYRGSLAKRQAKARDSWRVAKKIEDYINNDMASMPRNCVRQYTSFLIAVILMGILKLSGS